MNQCQPQMERKVSSDLTAGHGAMFARPSMPQYQEGKPGPQGYMAVNDH